MRIQPLALVIALAGMGLAGKTQGSLIAYDGFDYSAGVLPGQNGGAGWTGGWTAGTGGNNTVVNDSGSLLSSANPLGDLSVGGFAQKSVTGSGNSSNALRAFSAPIDMTVDGNTFYASFLIRKDANGGSANDNVEFALDDSTTTGADFRIGSTSGEFFFAGGASTVTSTVASTLGTTYFVLVKGVSHASTADEFYIKVYSPGDLALTAEPLSWDITLNTTLASKFDGVRLTTGTAATGAFDEIRVGTGFADLLTATPAPEPMTPVMMIAGAMVMGGVRQRRGGK